MILAIADNLVSLANAMQKGGTQRVRRKSAKGNPQTTNQKKTYFLFVSAGVEGRDAFHTKKERKEDMYTKLKGTR